MSATRGAGRRSAVFASTGVGEVGGGEERFGLERLNVSHPMSTNPKTNKVMPLRFIYGIKTNLWGSRFEVLFEPEKAERPEW
jgi:hypothetical protein